MISVTDLRAGVVFEDRGEYFLVLSYDHIKMGRGSGTVKVKVRNLSTGATIDKSFVTGARVEEANLERKKASYLYQDGQGYHLMDILSFEQFTIDRRLVEDMARFFKEGMEITLFAVGDKPLYVEIPKIIEYKIAQTGGSARGNTVGASYKDALLENGLSVKVPLFIKVGESIKVSTQSGEYAGRS